MDGLPTACNSHGARRRHHRDAVRCDALVTCAQLRDDLQQQEALACAGHASEEDVVAGAEIPTTNTKTWHHSMQCNAVKSMATEALKPQHRYENDTFR